MRTLAIGDIHGQAAALDALLARVWPTEDDLIVTLGDYVDGGTDSCGVIDRLIRLGETHRLVALRGNHDQLMLDARKGEAEREMWETLGGRVTLASYGGSIGDVPASHWRFLGETCVDWHETETHILVHAHVDPALSMPLQRIETLHWKSIRNMPCLSHASGKVVVCGHTSQADGRPLDLGHTVCIDTLKGGWLTCLDVVARTGWQANREGVCRDICLSQRDVRNP